jgi:hypothetical protein
MTAWSTLFWSESATCRSSASFRRRKSRNSSALYPNFPRIAAFNHPSNDFFIPGHLTYAKWDGASWSSQVITDTEVSIDKPALAVDKADHAHISYYDSFYRELHALTWASNWQTQLVATTGNEANLAVDIHNRPLISYSTNPLPDYYHVQLANWTPGGYWKYREALPFEAGNHAFRLEYDAFHQPLPIFSYADQHDPAHTHLGFAQWDGSAFVTQTVDSGDGTGFDSSLAFDNGAKPIIGNWI